MNIILFEEAETGKPLPRRDERSLHLLKVLHKKSGDVFEAGILGGYRGLGRIESVRPDGSIIYSLDLREAPPPRYPVSVCVGFPRPIQIRRLLRDLSNLGLAAIDLVGTDLGEKSYRNTKLLLDGGAHAALVEGAVQARDTQIPILSSYNSLEEWLAECPWDDKSTDEPNPLLIAMDNVRPEGSLALLSAHGQSIILAVGCERGWSDNEREKLEKAGFLRLSMGERALRTETACVAAAALALEKIGALG